MSLVTSKEMLLQAQKGRYAVGAFNAENMEMVLAIIEAAEEQRAPVIVQTTPSTVRYANTKMYGANVRAAAQQATVPVCLHLDHGNQFELAVKALYSGYTSIMIDGSQYSFEENVTLSRSVVNVAKCVEIPVEAELGSVGGKEDDLTADGGYTDPDAAADFVLQTGVDSLAVAIGTAHGIYSKIPTLDLPLLKHIRSKVAVPLVLHGASGLSDESVRACIENGICKVNFATELRIAYTAGVRSVLGDQTVFDPKRYGKAGRSAVKEVVQSRIAVCGCAGKV